MAERFKGDYARDDYRSGYGGDYARDNTTMQTRTDKRVRTSNKKSPKHIGKTSG